MPDVSQFGEKIVTTVRTFVARSLAPIEARVAALETKPSHEAVLEQAQRAVATGQAEIIGRCEAAMDKRFAALPPPEKGECGTDGKDGRDGVDGRSVSLEEVKEALWPAVAEWTDDHVQTFRRASDEAFKTVLTEHLKSIPPPKDGVDGKDGRSITVDEIKALIEPLLELRFAAYVVEHERRLPDVLQRMIDQLEKPTDGRDGKDGKDGRDGKDGVDGADGFDLRHLDVVQNDERSFTVRFKDLRREISRQLTFPVPIERGIWKADRPYVRGDLVTWGGSGWVKQTDEPGGKPEESAHWRLFVKRGRDGKDGEKGEKGDTGKAGRNGRDLTQLGHDGSKW